MLADILCVFGLLAMVQMIIYSAARADGSCGRVFGVEFVRRRVAEGTGYFRRKLRAGMSGRGLLILGRCSSWGSWALLYLLSTLGGG